MKKLWITGIICALAVSMAGCGESKTANTDSSLNEEPVVQEQSTAAETTADSEVKEEKTQETVESTDTAAAAGDLYEAFKNGDAKVKYTGNGDRTSYLDTKSALKVGESYTISEIVSALEAVSENKASSDVKYTDIDCGEDGVKELLAEVQFGEEFTLYMIIKQIDDELVMCFDQDGWSRSYVTVNADGTIESGGSSGAAVHSVDYAFVDQNGDYKFYYGVEETLTLYGDFYAYKNGTDYVTISTEGLDIDHLGVRDYYFDADYENRSHYYSYFVIDDSFEDVTTDSDYDDSNELKKRFTEAGIETYTKAEMEQMVKDRASEIGYKQ